MRRARAKLTVNTFPFLAVLLGAMGSLIFFLLVMDRRAKIVAHAKANDTLEARRRALAAEDADVLAEAKKRRDERDREIAEQKRLRDEQKRLRDDLDRRLVAEDKMLRGELARVEKDATKTAAALKDEEGGAGALLEEEERLRRWLALASKDLEARRKSGEAAKTRSEASRKALLALTADLVRMENVLADLKERRRTSADTFSVVPYRGKYGENRKPIYVECAREGVVFQPEGKRFGADLEAIRDEIRRRGAALALIKERSRRDPPAPELPHESTGPYVLCLIRPDGLDAYQRLCAAIAGRDIDFGYELVDADWKLSFPTEMVADDAPPLTRPTRIAKGIPVSRPGPGGGAGGSVSGDAGRGATGGGAPGDGGPFGATLGGPGFAPGAPLGAIPAGEGATGRSIGGVSGSVGGLPGTASGGVGVGPGGGTGGPFGGSMGGSAGIPGAGIGGGLPDAIADGSARGPIRGTPGYPGSAAGALTGGTGDGFAGAGGGMKPGPIALALGDIAFSPFPSAGGGGAPPSTFLASLAVKWGESSPGGPGSAMMGGGGTTGGTSSGAPRGSGETPALAVGRLEPFPHTNPPKAGDPSMRGAGSGGAPGADSGGPGAAADGGAVAWRGKSSKGREGGEPSGEPGEGGPRFAGMGEPGSGKGKPRPPSVGLMLGNRDFIIAIACTETEAILTGAAARFPLNGPADQQARNAAELAQSVQRLIARRQASLRPGETPYRPMIRFQVYPGGLRSYYRVYPPLESLGVPMTRENVE